MKRLFVMAVLLIATALCASAQYKEYYTVEEVGQEYPSLYMFKIDWNNKLFFLEGDGHNDGPIKNYKENGNVRIFDVYSDPGSGLNEKVYSVKFTPDEGDNYTIELNMNGYKAVYKVTTKKPAGRGSDSGSINDKISAKTQAMKEAIGRGVTKGLDAIKNKSKKKGDNKADDEK